MPVTVSEEKYYQHDWHALKAEDVLSHLKVQDEGLSSVEAEKRLEYYGPNQLKETPRPGIEPGYPCGKQFSCWFD